MTHFVNGFFISKETAPPQKRTSKFPWAQIPVGSAVEIDSATWPAETKLNSRGTSNAAASAYAWARRNGYVFQVDHLACGNVKVYNVRERGKA